MKTPKTNEVVEKLQGKSVFILTGSRSVLKDLPPGTDYDFIALDEPVTRKYLSELGFKEFSNWKKHKEYFDSGSSEIYYFYEPLTHTTDIGNSTVQVVLKKPEYWFRVKRFWQIMRDNPELFKESFWKSNPKHGNKYDAMNKICERINFMLNDYLPYVPEVYTLYK